MADYLMMDRAALQQEQHLLQQEYQRFMQKNLKLDMSRGKPSPKQLDLSLGLLQAADYIDADGVDTRNYGQLEGTPEARRFFSRMLGVQPAETIVGGNSSLQMMYNCIDMGWRQGFADSPKPWRMCEKIKFLCPSPGYDRHFRVTEVFGFELVLVPMTPGGPDMDVVEQLVQDEAVKGIWCIPIYSNPDGYTYSADTVRRLATMKTAAPDFRIFWDNAYGVHHFGEVEESCPNILDACRAAGCENRPLLFCSTSKITFAGGGVGAAGGSAANIDAVLKYLFVMTITADKVNQLRHVRFLENEGGVAAHMKKQAALVAPKFETVIRLFHRGLDGCGPIAHWTEPNGGYFLSLYVMDGCAKRVVELCKQAGVVLTGAGAAFPYGKDPDDRHIRIAPTFPPIEELETAAELVCLATRLACVEKLLA